MIYIRNHENNVASRSSPQWLCGNSCTYQLLLVPMNKNMLNKLGKEHNISDHK